LGFFGSCYFCVRVKSLSSSHIIDENIEAAKLLLRFIKQLLYIFRFVTPGRVKSEKRSERQEGTMTPPRPDPINTRAVLKTFIGGSPQELPQKYQIASPINYVSRSLPPTLLPEFDVKKCPKTL
jgi:hypothetical protein